MILYNQVKGKAERQKESRTMKKLRMYYYLQNQSEMFSKPRMFETSDMKEWEHAVSIAHEKGYKIVKVENVE